MISAVSWNKLQLNHHKGIYILGILDHRDAKQFSNIFSLTLLLSRRGGVMRWIRRRFDTSATISSIIHLFFSKSRSTSSQMSFKIGVLKILANFTRKYLCFESLFNEAAGLKACNFIKKRLQDRCFPVKFANFFRTPPVAASANLLLRLRSRVSISVDDITRKRKFK